MGRVLLGLGVLCSCVTFSLACAAIQNNMFAYINEQQDASSNLLILGGYRHYNSAIGFFIKQDSYSPFLSHKTVNGFNYAAGNPVVQVDKSGHMPTNAPPASHNVVGDENYHPLDDLSVMWQETRRSASQMFENAGDSVLDMQDALRDGLTDMGNQVNEFTSGAAESLGLGAADLEVDSDAQISEITDHALGSSLRPVGGQLLTEVVPFSAQASIGLGQETLPSEVNSISTLGQVAVARNRFLQRAGTMVRSAEEEARSVVVGGFEGAAGGVVTRMALTCVRRVAVPVIGNVAQLGLVGEGLSWISGFFT